MVTINIHESDTSKETDKSMEVDFAPPPQNNSSAESNNERGSNDSAPSPQNLQNIHEAKSGLADSAPPPSSQLNGEITGGANAGILEASGSEGPPPTMEIGNLSSSNNSPEPSLQMGNKDSEVMDNAPSPSAEPNENEESKKNGKDESKKK